ncbi:MAG: YeeE/YedE family protein [Spirochaetales bacterium]|nr:YeeE/YedE family protein [Spirochaetales bacterium]
MDEKKSYPFHELVFKKEWSYTTGAVMLAILSLALVTVTNQAWGVTGPLAVWGGKVLEFVGINADSWKGFNGSIARYDFFTNVPSITDVGIVFGALLATLLAAQFKIKKIKSRKNVYAAIVGGLLMGFGARLSAGCNIGAFFSGLPAFSLHGWVFWIAIFGGAAVGSKLLTKYFM